MQTPQNSTLSFTKAQEIVGLNFKKKGLKTIPVVRLAFCDDLSGSTHGYHSSGIIDQTANLLLAAAGKCDDNGELEVFGFSTGSGMLGVVTPSDYGTDFMTHMLYCAPFALWNSTVYSKVLYDMVAYYHGGSHGIVQDAAEAVKGLGEKLLGSISSFFGKKKEDPKPVQDIASGTSDPAFILFLTDGDCDKDDVSNTYDAVEWAAGKSIFIQFVGVGNSGTFNLLKTLAQTHPHVGFQSMTNMDYLTSPEVLYNEVFSDKFIQWYKQGGWGEKQA